MKIEKLTLLIFIIVILTISWKTYFYFNPNFEKCFAENNEDFKSKTQELNQIVRDINNLNLRENYNIPINKLPIILKNKLEKLGIDSINYIKIVDDNCKDKHIIELNIDKNWNVENLNNVKLIYSPCDENTKLNYHFYDGRHIDSWGQGGNWLILSDTDLI